NLVLRLLACLAIDVALLVAIQATSPFVAQTAIQQALPRNLQVLALSKELSRRNHVQLTIPGAILRTKQHHNHSHPCRAQVSLKGTTATQLCLCSCVL